MAEGVTLQLFDWRFSPVGQVADYQEASVDWVHMDAGTGHLTLPEEPPFRDLLLAVDQHPVLLVATIAGVRWPGRVQDVELERTGTGVGVITASVVSEWIWLRYMLASQNGPNPSVSAMPAQDTFTGPAASAAAYFINAAASRLGVPVVAIPPADDTSTQVTLSGRFPDTLADLLVDPMTAAGVAIEVDVWLPGDDYPAAERPDQPVIVFSPHHIEANPGLRWSDLGSSTDRVGKISGLKLHLAAGVGYRAPVGLSGTDADRVYDYVIDPTQDGGRYALPELFVDASGTDLGADSQARGLEEIAKGRGTASATFSVEDGSPHAFGRDYRAGDIGILDVPPVLLQDRVTKVNATVTPDAGTVITPTIGETTVDDSDVQILARAVADVRRHVTLLQRR